MSTPEVNEEDIEEENIVVEARGVLSSPLQIHYIRSRLFIPEGACVLKDNKNTFYLYGSYKFINDSFIREYLHCSYKGGWNIPEFSRYDLFKPRILVVDNGRCYIEKNTIDDLLYRRRIPEITRSALDMLVSEGVDG